MRLWAWVRRMIARLGKSEETLKLEALFRKAAKASTEAHNAKAAAQGDATADTASETQKHPTEDGEVQYDLEGDSKYDFTKPFDEQIDDFKNGLFPQRDTLLIGGTSNFYQKLGFNALPMTINRTHVDYALNGTKDANHHVGETLLKQLPSKIDDPVAVFISQTQSSTSVVSLLKFQVNGKEAIAPIYIDGFGIQNGVEIDSNAVTSLYGKDNSVTKLLKEAIAEHNKGKFSLLYINKKEALTLLHRAGLQLPGSLIPDGGFIHSIRENDSPVKPKYNNATESRQFKRWFGDWQKHAKSASKIVNIDGTPKVMYCNTMSSHNNKRIMDCRGNVWL